MSYPANQVIDSRSLNGTSAAVERRVISMEEADQLDKTINVLAGRAEELRERLCRVLTPLTQAAGMNGEAKEPDPPPGSMLTERFRDMRRIADCAITTIDDILRRLEA